LTVFSKNTSAHTRDELVGSWKLVSAFSRHGAEHSGQPYGANPLGFLTYSDDGRVSALISCDGRNPLSIGGGTLEEKAEAFDTFFAYAGRYTLEGDKVIHHVEISSIQNYVGKDLMRRVLFEGDRIILVTPPTPVNGKIQILELTWQRLPGVS
jgi:Lipocalin-like domain